VWEAVKVLEAWAARLEDRAEVFVRGEETVVVVADGAGGRPGAAYTAETTVRMVGEFVTGRTPRWDPLAWCTLLRRIDEALAHDPAAGETTAVVAVLSPEGILGASVGDSGAWLITPDALRDLTAHQQRKPFLGTGVAVPVPFAAPWTEGSTLLAASDASSSTPTVPRSATGRGEPTCKRRRGKSWTWPAYLPVNCGRHYCGPVPAPSGRGRLIRPEPRRGGIGEPRATPWGSGGGVAFLRREPRRWHE
jgi:hypothetical protein